MGWFIAILWRWRLALSSQGGSDPMEPLSLCFSVKTLQHILILWWVSLIENNYRLVIHRWITLFDLTLLSSLWSLETMNNNRSVMKMEMSPVYPNGRISINLSTDYWLKSVDRLMFYVKGPKHCMYRIWQKWNGKQPCFYMDKLITYSR